MSVKDVNALRRAGRLGEAYRIAKSDLERETSEWTLSALFWVLRDIGQRLLEERQPDRAGRCLEEMKSVQGQMADEEGYARASLLAMRRSLARLLYDVGRREEAIEVYRELLRLQRQFYLWKELAQMTDDPDLRLSALCCALLTSAKDEFLGEVHLMLAEILIERGMFAEACHELSVYESVYRRNRWTLKGDYYLLSGRLPADSKKGQGGKAFYRSHATRAEDFVNPSVLAVVDSVNQQRKLFHCVTVEKVGLVVYFNWVSYHPTLGEFILLRTVESRNREGKPFRRVASVSPTDRTDSRLRRSVQGRIRIRKDKKGQLFGVVKSNYIPKRFLSGVNDGDIVAADLVFNGEKWMVIHITT